MSTKDLIDPSETFRHLKDKIDGIEQQAYAKFVQSRPRTTVFITFMYSFSPILNQALERQLNSLYTHTYFYIQVILSLIQLDIKCIQLGVFILALKTGQNYDYIYLTKRT